jgi:hypothetical protein
MSGCVISVRLTQDQVKRLERHVNSTEGQLETALCSVKLSRHAIVKDLLDKGLDVVERKSAFPKRLAKKWEPKHQQVPKIAGVALCHNCGEPAEIQTNLAGPRPPKPTRLLGKPQGTMD